MLFKPVVSLFNLVYVWHSNFWLLKSMLRGEKKYMNIAKLIIGNNLGVHSIWLSISQDNRQTKCSRNETYPRYSREKFLEFSEFLEYRCRSTRQVMKNYNVNNKLSMDLHYKLKCFRVKFPLHTYVFKTQSKVIHVLRLA